MSHEFMERLDKARCIAETPFIINSAYRSIAYELERGRTGTSSHTKGVAVDLRCTDGAARLQIIRGLLAAGFVRIGIGKTFIHVDYDTEKTPNIWLYR